MAEILRLRVRNALVSPAHTDLATVELSPEVMDRAGLEEEDVVKLSGRRTCGGIVFRSYVVDEESARLPGFLQRNAGVVEGEYVLLKKINPPEAKLVTISASFSQSEGITRYLHEKLKGAAVCEGDIVPVRSIFGPVLYLQVVSVQPRRLVRVGRKTIITLKPASEQATASAEESPRSTGLGLPLLDAGIDLGMRRLVRTPVTTFKGREPLRIDLRETAPRVHYDDIGGLAEQIRQVREIIELPLRYPEMFKRLCIEPPRGVLFTGPPGTGKTLLARAAASSVSANVFTVRGPEFVSKWYGESEARLREIFSDGKNASPSIIIFDEIDSIASKRGESEGREVERRILSTLLTLMDGLGERGDVVVIGTTNDPDALDPALRRPGRFDREITFPVPNAEGRYQIMKIHTRDMPLAKDADLVKIAERTHGFTGADIEAICREAALASIRRHLPNIEGEPDALTALVVEEADFEVALGKVSPSSLRGWLTLTAKTRSEDIGGHREVKRRLLESIILPVKDPKRYRRMGVEPIKGVILHGPPGTGKTMLCRWIAFETESNTILVNSTEMVSKFVGESEKRIRAAFEAARSSSPSVLVFDEIDAICPKRGGESDMGVASRMVSTFLMEMDGLRPLLDVVVIGTTNRIDILDPALLRPGRFDLKIHVPLPDEEERFEIFKICTSKMPLSEDIALLGPAKATEGFSGADIALLCREAALNALTNGRSKVSARDFEEALKVHEMKAKTEKAGASYRV